MQARGKYRLVIVSRMKLDEARSKRRKKKLEWIGSSVYCLSHHAQVAASLHYFAYQTVGIPSNTLISFRRNFVGLPG